MSLTSRSELDWGFAGFWLIFAPSSFRWARNPCNLSSRRPDNGDSAVAGERPKNLRVAKPARECVSSPAVPSNPNSRLGRGRSPFAQGWDRMDPIMVGIDVSKDRLDVAFRPTGEN